MGGQATGGRVFYGWKVVAALFVVLAVSSGLGFYGQAVYLSAFIDRLGLSNAVASVGTAIVYATSGVVGILVARLLARRDARYVIVTGGVLAAAALALLGRVEQVWQLYLVELLFGVGFAASSLIPVTTIVTRWFARRRALALAVVSTGLSVGGIVVTPPAAWLIDQRGLSGAMPWLGLAFLLGVVPVTLLVVRDHPDRLGLRPDDDPVAAPAADGAPSRRPAPSVPRAAALRTRFFVWSTAAYVLIMLAQVGGIAHQFELVEERVGRDAAAAAVSTLAASSVVARLVGGWVATRVSVRGMAVALCGVQGTGLVLLSQLDGRGGLLVGSVVFGASVGNLLLLQPLLVVEAFGVADYPHLFSRAQLVTTIGIALGPALLGIVHDATDAYTVPYALAAAASLAAAAVMGLAAGPTRPASVPASASSPPPATG